MRLYLAALPALAILMGCVANDPSADSSGNLMSASPASLPSEGGAERSALLPGVKAPESCGFPQGTALSYAGRSTTAALNVQEVVGDPMSFDPADIYVTRDKFDQGQMHGRLVCAIFVNDPDFVEVTVHPADGGRFSVTPPPPVPAPSDGITREDAVGAARNALPDPDRISAAGPSRRTR